MIAPTARPGQDARLGNAQHQNPRRSAGVQFSQPTRHGRRRAYWPGWPLGAVLAVQALLSARLIRANSAFQDEALYLWAGHLQWAHWLHHVPITPAFPSYFSGAPVIYPLVGAAADSVGGLAGARLISLCFMLGATALLWSAARQLFGDLAAFCAAAVFAGTAAAQFLGAFATYDAMALILLAAAAWCAIRGGVSQRGKLWLTAVVVLLAVANATKYASVLWDPVVLALAGLTVARRRGWRAGAVVAACLTVTITAVLTLAVLAASPAYWAGIRFSTLARSAGTAPSLTVLWQATGWIGPLAALAFTGAVLLHRRRVDPPLAWIGWTLAAAVLLAPAEQARIHTGVSLFKHVGYGGWFGAMVAGYALATLASRAAAGRETGSGWSVTPGGVLASGCAAALLGLAAVGAAQAGRHYASWPNSAALVATLRPLAAAEPGPSLAEDPFVPSYYLRDPTGSWSSTWYFRYLDPVTQVTLNGMPAYADAIRRHYFKFVVIGLTTTPGADQAIEGDLLRTRGYAKVAVVPWSAGQLSGQYQVWRYEPDRWAIRRHDALRRQSAIQGLS